MITKAEENRIFHEALNGYGFDEIQLSPDGEYCTGCMRVFKRPNKMYKGGMGGKEIMCRHCIVKFYNPEEK